MRKWRVAVLFLSVFATLLVLPATAQEQAAAPQEATAKFINLLRERLFAEALACVAPADAQVGHGMWAEIPVAQITAEQWKSILLMGLLFGKLGGQWECQPAQMVDDQHARIHAEQSVKVAMRMPVRRVDGKWLVDPSGMTSPEPAEAPVTAAPEASPDTLAPAWLKALGKPTEVLMEWTVDDGTLAGLLPQVGMMAGEPETGGMPSRLDWALLLSSYATDYKFALASEEGGTALVDVTETLVLPLDLALVKTDEGWRVDFVATIGEEVHAALADERGQATNTACLSNLKQICLAVMMYVQDYDGVFPKKPEQGTIKDLLMPYVKSDQVFRCPDQEEGRVSYAFNEALLGKRIDELENPAEVVLVYECKGEEPRDWGNPLTDGEERHNDGANYGYADGHVQFLPEPPATDLAALAGVEVNGVKLDCEVTEIGGVRMVPVRAICEALKIEVRFNDADGSVGMQSKAVFAKVNVGAPYAAIGGKRVPLAQPMKVQNGQAIIPADFFADAFGCKVEWDDALKLLRISDG